MRADNAYTLPKLGMEVEPESDGSQLSGWLPRLACRQALLLGLGNPAEALWPRRLWLLAILLRLVQLCQVKPAGRVLRRGRSCWKSWLAGAGWPGLPAL